MPDSSDKSTDLTVKEIGGMQVQLVDQSRAQVAITERILASDSLEAIFDAQNTANADAVNGRPFLLKNVEFFESTFDEGPGVYAILHCDFVDDGSKGVVTCGGSNVIAQLIATSKFGMPDFPVALKRNERPTSNGFFPLWLTKA